MALELGRRHIAVVLQNPSWGELAPEVRLLQQGRRTRPDSWPAWSPSAPSNWPSASRHREASPCQACRGGWTPEDGAAASFHGGLVEEDPQVCPSFGSKHDVVADVRKLAAVAAPEAVSVPADTSPTMVKFPALAVLLMVNVLHSGGRAQQAHAGRPGDAQRAA